MEDLPMELLDQEEEYRRVNNEIELRTRRIMEEVDAVVSRQNLRPSKDPLFAAVDQMYESATAARARVKSSRRNSLSSDSNTTVTPRIRSATPDRCYSMNRRKMSGNDVLPSTMKGMSSESQARYVKAQCKVLQEELTASKRENSIRSDELKKAQNELKTSEEERVKLSADLGGAREKIKKHETVINTLTNRLNITDSENSLLKKEVDSLRQELKKVSLTSSGSETKLNKTKNELEKAKIALKEAQLSVKEAKEKGRATEEEMYLTIKKLERQKSELISALKKQIQLIDNLKLQNGYLEANGLSRITHDEFLKLLEWRG